MTVLHSDGPPPSIRASYVICTTPRSGSNFLCEVLQGTEVAGRPDEYFWNPPSGHGQRTVPEYRAYVERIQQAGTTPNGVFEIKLMWGYFGEMVDRLATLTDRAESRPPAVLAAVFPNPKYVWLTRLDKVRQAISWNRALTTQRWRSTDAAVEGTPEPTFDFEAIDALVGIATADDRAWRDFFDRHGIEPLVIVYEELAQDPEQACRRVLDFLQLSSHSHLPEPAYTPYHGDDALRRFDRVMRETPAPAVGARRALQIVAWLAPIYARWFRIRDALDPERTRLVEVRLEDLAEDWPRQRRLLFEALGLDDVETPAGFEPVAVHHRDGQLSDHERAFVVGELGWAIERLGFDPPP